ncbi:hypothetical protein CEXT_70091 [Caerostris extrusa]|uniref:Uncharacterized protein n=1 Tax=Caerostris extrusa TaxID=172846 RepID=A0AAV4U6Q2_CAEEX|nr:hypothetical protein CEXT_70091 [Caerostris extrusa]
MKEVGSPKCALLSNSIDGNRWRVPSLSKEVAFHPPPPTIPQKEGDLVRFDTALVAPDPIVTILTKLSPLRSSMAAPAPCPLDICHIPRHPGSPGKSRGGGGTHDKK